MRKLAFLAPLVATLALATVAQAQSRVTVTVAPSFSSQVQKLGDREVNEQIANLQSTVEQALDQRYPGATANLVLKDLKPNRPTMKQVTDSPGLDPIRSVSIGGAAVEGEIITADGQRRPVNFSYFTPDLRDVWGYSVWRDADRAFERLGARIEQGRF